CVSCAWSQTFKDYQRRVNAAVSALDTLTQSDETESESAYEARVAQTVARLRQVLPEGETVEWDGTILTVGNKWLHEELEKYEKSGEPDRPEVLKRIIERLQAIAERLKEVESATADSLTKDDAKTKLAEILGRPDYAKQSSEGSAFARLWKRVWKWLESLLPKQKPMSPGGASFFTQLAQILVVVLALVVLAYVIKMFAPRLFKRTGSKKKDKREPRIVLGETLAPDQSAGDLLAEAEALARRGELRAAIRKAYIALLVELGDRKVISLAQYKTNRDYLRAVRELDPLYRNMKGLTDSFERHWYGLAGATEEDWMAFRAGYKKALTHGDPS
ncbi:MAG: DUF4129 domain-containing protein, partial [Pyrinomonadaceae bacterium]